MAVVPASEIKGRPVIAIDEGVQIGVVERLYLDLPSRRLIGLAIDPGGSSLAQTPRIMADIGEILAIGPDVLTVASRAAVTGEALAAYDGPLVDVDDLRGLDVITEDGVKLGQVSTVELDRDDRRLALLEISKGRLKPPMHLPASSLRAIGLEAIVAASPATETPVPPLQQEGLGAEPIP